MGRFARQLLRVLAGYAAMLGAYLALSGSADAVEITCAAASAVPAALLGARMAAVSRRDFALRLPARAVLRPLGSLLPDLFATGRALARAAFAPRAAGDAALESAQRGGFTRQPFRSGGPEAATRRAAVVIGTSLAPRTFVVRGEAHGELLLHSLPGRAASPDRDWPS